MRLRLTVNGSPPRNHGSEVRLTKGFALTGCVRIDPQGSTIMDDTSDLLADEERPRARQWSSPGRASHGALLSALTTSRRPGKQPNVPPSWKVCANNWPRVTRRWSATAVTASVPALTEDSLGRPNVRFWGHEKGSCISAHP